MMMRLAKPIKTIANEDGTIAGYITALPVNGIICIVVQHKRGGYLIHDVPVDDLNYFSQDVIYRLVRRARSKCNGN